MDVSFVYTKVYENKTLGKRGKNKANTNPIKANSNPISAEKTPKQSQFKAKQTQSSAKNSCARLWALLQCFSENFDKPGEPKAGCSARPKLRTDPMNLLGTMPAKGGKIDLKHSFCWSAFYFIVVGYKNYKFQKLTKEGNKNDRD